ncbi:MAG: hypothetical protein HY720_11040 [Planctomycetes bacterium]|nr:hypothetical protein [Planctomycetota bacterium]
MNLILRALVLFFLAGLSAAPPVLAQGDPEFDPRNPGEVKRPIEIEDVAASGGGDHWEFRIKGRADYEDGCLVNLVLRYPAIDPNLARGVAWTETLVDKGRFEQTISFSGQVLFPGLYEAVAVFSGANQPEPFAEKYKEEYREGNHIFSLGSEGEIERT